MPSSDVPNVTELLRVFETIGDADLDHLATLYTTNYVLELPHTANGPVVIEGRDAVMDHLADVFSWIRLQLTLNEVYPCVDTDTVIAEYASTGTILDGAGSRPYANTYIGVWQFRNGLVRRTREFYNPVET